MLSNHIQEAINRQINAEIWSAYLYLSMSNWCAHNGYEGMASWMRIQCHEEFDHSEVLSQYILRRNGKIELLGIGDVPTDWQSPFHVFEEVLRHEIKVTEMINELTRLAIKEGDFATQNRMQWFIEEQVEEEDKARQILSDMHKYGESDCNCGLQLLDKDMGRREYVATYIQTI